MSARILLVEDDAALSSWVVETLQKRGFLVQAVAGGDAARGALEADDFDVVVTDLNLPGRGGLDLAQHVAANRPDTPVIVITAFGSLETAIAAIRAGAYDFLTKPFDIDALGLALQRAVTHRSLKQEVRRLRRALEPTRRFDSLIGGHSSMQRVYELIERVAETEASVLILGETGTGKELVARAIHQRSPRRQGPFVAVNCAALPTTLLESELFGHVKGAFTDAGTARRGLFAEASGGTLFLDELGEMPLELQPKLLRTLEERKIRAVGSDKETTIDVRLVAATNRDLELAVEEKRFREDLFYRINVLQIALPALRERGSDLLLLAQTFLESAAASQNRPVTGISAEAAAKLVQYNWPGNVRELKNCIERAVALTRFDRLVVEDLPERVASYRPERIVLSAEAPVEVQPLEEIEKRYILWAVEALGGNRSLAAERLGVDRKTLYRRLSRYESSKS
ncbi:MAG: sigma-54 dependent transcriptional regulator [Myxococcota bacterium]